MSMTDYSSCAMNSCLLSWHRFLMVRTLEVLSSGLLAVLSALK